MGPEAITLRRLRDAIEGLPDDLLVIPNSIGNLAFYRPDGETFAGYLNFWRGRGEFHPADDDDEANQ